MHLLFLPEDIKHDAFSQIPCSNSKEKEKETNQVLGNRLSVSDNSKSNQS